MNEPFRWCPYFLWPDSDDYCNVVHAKLPSTSFPNRRLAAMLLFDATSVMAILYIFVRMLDTLLVLALYWLLRTVYGIFLYTRRSGSYRCGLLIVLFDVGLQRVSVHVIQSVPLKTQP
jgi:hypothetical protein